MPTVRVGRLRLPVEPGAALRQGVSPSRRWREALERSGPTAQALPEDRATVLVSALDAALDKQGLLRRDALYRCAAEGPLDEALLIVMAWGLGATGRWNFMTPLVRKALQDSFLLLVHSRRAVVHGIDAGGLWDAHFGNGAPHGLGSIAFGSKWLHAVGYDRVETGPQPLVYDHNIWVGLSGCAGLSGWRKPTGRPRSNWLEWCSVADELAQDSDCGISAADVEVALFSHARNCTNDRDCMLRH